MYKIDMRGGAWGAVVQKSFTRTDPTTSGFRFQLPGSGSSKICGTPILGAKYQLHIQTFLLSKPKSQLLKNLNGSSGFSIKLTEIK